MTGRRTPAVDHMMRDAYDAASPDWAGGPDRVYELLAAGLVTVVPMSLTGRRVLDVGAGTGAVSRAVLATGGSAVALDGVEGMAIQSRASGLPAICGDAVGLPFRDASFDAAVAAFSLTHLTDPVPGIREAARVVAPGGAVVVGGFGPGEEHPVKAAVEEAARCRGWCQPAWYLWLKSEAEPVLKSVSAMATAAATGGLTDIQVDEGRVDVGMLSALDLVRYRLGMPNMAPFVAALTPSIRAELITDALARLGPRPAPFCPIVITMRALVP